MTDEVMNPLVFQCTNCKVIVGDSFSWLNADQELNMITLTSKSSTNVHVETGDMQFSSDGVDCGSAYFEMKCSSCSLTLGKSYKSTPRKWDALRDMYSFDLNAISSYQLGVDSPVNMEIVNESLSMPSGLEVRSTLMKLQTAVLHLNERIEKISQQLANAQQTSKTSSAKLSSNKDQQLKRQKTADENLARNC